MGHCLVREKIPTLKDTSQSNKCKNNIRNLVRFILKLNKVEIKGDAEFLKALENCVNPKSNKPIAEEQSLKDSMKHLQNKPSHLKK